MNGHAGAAGPLRINIGAAAGAVFFCLAASALWQRVLDGWVVVVPPDGWTGHDTERVEEK